MKKTIKSLFAIALTAFAFVSCSDVPEPYQIPGEKKAGGQELPAGTIMSTDFKANGPSNWKTQDVVHPSEIEDVWTYNSKYGMVATAALNSGANNYASESWLLSPEIDLTNESTAYLTISHAGNYFSNISNECAVMISSDYGTRSIADDATWEKLTIDTWPTNFTYVDGGANIDKYAGKKIHLAFKYTSTSSKAGTWEIGSVTITQQEPSQEMPEGLEGEGTAEKPYTIADAMKIIEKVGEKTSDEVYVKGIVSGYNTSDAFNPQYGNLSYYISADGTENNQLGVYRGYGLGGEKFKTGTEIKPGDNVIIVGQLVNYKGNTPQFTTGSKIYSLNGETAGGGGDDPTPGTPSGTGTENDPFNVAAAVAKCKEVGTTASAESYYIKGIADAEYTVTSYKNVEIDIVDAAGSTEKFKVFRVKDKEGKGIKEGYKIEKGAVIIVYGPVINYKSNTPETATGAYLVSVNGKAPEVDEGGESGGGGEGGGQGGGEVSGNTLTVTFADFGFTNAQEMTSINLTDGTTLTFDAGGGTTPKYYNAGTNIRIYAKNTMTINAGSKKISAIEIACDTYSGTLCNASGDVNCEGTKMTIDDASLKASGINKSTATVANVSTQTSTPSQVRMTKLIITYAQ